MAARTQSDGSSTAGWDREEFTHMIGTDRVEYVTYTMSAWSTTGAQVKEAIDRAVAELRTCCPVGRPPTDADIEVRARNGDIVVRFEKGDGR